MLAASARSGPGLSGAAALGVLIAAILSGVSAGGAAPVAGRPPLSAAVATLPTSMLAVGFTDWVMALDGHTASAARERDLLTRSVFYELPAELRDPLGFGDTDIVWEAYARDFQQEVEVVRLKRGVAPRVDVLRAAGYRRTDGVWVADVGATASGSVVDALAWLPRQRLVVTSSKAAAVRDVLAVVSGDRPALAANPTVRSAVEGVSGSTSVLLESAPIGCAATTVAGSADVAAQVEAAQDRHGRLEQYRILGRGLSDRGSGVQRFVVAMPFASAVQAARQARVRAALSTGPFIGRLGSMDEVLRLRSTHVFGSAVVLAYDHPVNAEVLMTGRGPLLPAAC